MSEIDIVRRRLHKLHHRASWGQIADKLGLKKGTVHRTATDENYEPKDPHIRARLGLPTLVPAPACRHCGQAHVSNRCPARRKPRKPWMEAEEWEAAVERVMRLF